MKHRLLTAFAFAAFCSTASATSLVAFAIGDLRDASGTPLADDTSTWAIIVSNGAALPGGLTDGTSLDNNDIAQIGTDFDGINLTVGDKGSYTITHLGAISGYEGAVVDSATFTLTGVVTAGKLWGLYWFPGKAIGASLTGSYEIGGFAQSAANAASGGTFGTTVPTEGGNETSVNFIESGYNQNVLGGGDTGLSASRFTAVAIPEPSALTLSGLAALALLRRRRA